MYKRPIFEEIELGSNPFLSQVRVFVRVKEDKKSFRYAGNKDEEPLLLNNQYTVEQAPYVKLFVNATNRNTLVKLPVPSRPMFTWMMFMMEPGVDWVWLSHSRYQATMGPIALNTYKAGIKGIIDSGVIAESEVRDIYWINANVVFRGSRIKAYPNRLEIVATKKEQNEDEE